MKYAASVIKLFGGGGGGGGHNFPCAHASLCVIVVVTVIERGCCVISKGEKES